MKKLIYLLICLGSINAYAGYLDSIPMPQNQDMFEGVMDQYLKQQQLSLQQKQVEMARMEAEDGSRGENSLAKTRGRITTIANR